MGNMNKNADTQRQNSETLITCADFICRNRFRQWKVTAKSTGILLIPGQHGTDSLDPTPPFKAQLNALEIIKWIMIKCL